MTLTDDNYGVVLTRLLHETYLSIDKLAKKAGVGGTTIRYWLTMAHAPDLERLCWVLEALGYRLEVVPK